MLLVPPVMALSGISILTALILLMAAVYAIQVMTRWDLTSASENQIILEKKTYLISVLLSLAFLFEILSLLLFVFITDSLASLFTGAMCTVGVLNVNPFGFPTLLLKMAVFFLAFIWLLMNYVDNQAEDYPLLRFKYGYLLLILPLVLAETTVQTLYFLQLSPDIITSCCGSLFSTEGKRFASDLASLSPLPLMITMYLVLGVTLLIGLIFLLKRKGGYWYAVLSAASFPVVIVSIVSFISLYLYEHPNHHCPFCILKAEYYFQGYLLYLPLFLATSLGLSVGTLLPFAARPSLKQVIPKFTRRLTLWSVSLFAFEIIFVSKIILLSHLRLIES